MIHANTRNGHPFADCWYPGPPTTECDCFSDEKADQDSGWLASLRRHRERPDWPQVLPDDVDYGEPKQFCLDDRMRAAKPRAIDVDRVNAALEPLRSPDDPYCFLVELPAVLAATEELLGGEGALARWRKAVFEQLDTVLLL